MCTGDSPICLLNAFMALGLLSRKYPKYNGFFRNKELFSIGDMRRRYCPSAIHNRRLRYGTCATGIVRCIKGHSGQHTSLQSCVYSPCASPELDHPADSTGYQGFRISAYDCKSYSYWTQCPQDNASEPFCGWLSYSDSIG